MGKYFVPAIILGVCVIICLSKETPSITITPHHPLANLKPFDMDDFLKPPKMEGNETCHIPFKKCLDGLEVQDPFCALHKELGLITMPTICDVHFQNCLVQTDAKVGFGNTSNDDILYYNGKNHKCQYYFVNTKSLTEASILYVQGWVINDSDDELPTTTEAETTTETTTQ